MGRAQDSSVIVTAAVHAGRSLVIVLRREDAGFDRHHLWPTSRANVCCATVAEHGDWPALRSGRPIDTQSRLNLIY